MSGALIFIVAMASATQAAPPAAVNSAEGEVRAFQAELFTAMQRRDRATLERLIADGFIFVHSTGGADDKQQFIDNAVAGLQSSQTASPEYIDNQLRLYEHTAIRISRSVRDRGQPDEMNLRTVHAYGKVGGRWQWLSGQSTRLPTRPTAAKIDPRLFDEYAGRYVIDESRTFTVTRAGEALRGQVSGRPELELIPRSETDFVLFNPDSGLDTRIVFVRSDGVVTEAVFRRAGKEVWRAKRQKLPGA